MKKIISVIVLCLMATIAFGQARSLRVFNNTSCMVYFRAWARPLSNCPFAGSVGSASIIAIPPGMYLYPNSAALALPPDYFINAAFAYNYPLPCAPYPLLTYQVGDACTPFPLLQFMYSLNAGCTVCDQYYMRWDPAPTPGGEATLTFFYW